MQPFTVLGRLAAASIVVSLAGVSAEAAPIVLDDFSAGEVQLLVGSGFVVNHESDLEGVFTSERETTIRATSDTTIQVQINTPDQPDLAQLDFAGAGDVTFLYDAWPDGQPSDLDFTASGNDRIAIELLEAPVGGTVRIELYSTLPFAYALANITGPGVLEIPFTTFFDAFSPPRDTAAEFTHVDAFKVTFTHPDFAETGRYVIGRIQVVPEPASVSLLAAGLVAAMRRHRRG